jgi:hypothetical protein
MTQRPADSTSLYLLHHTDEPVCPEGDGVIRATPGQQRR